jgi:uncharacterized protein (TIGR03435 family)
VNSGDGGTSVLNFRGPAGTARHRLCMMMIAGIVACCGVVAAEGPARQQGGQTPQDKERQSEQSRPKITSADDPRLGQFVYDVVSIKPFRNISPAPRCQYGINDSPDGTDMCNMEALHIVEQAFMRGLSRVSGGPDWLAKDQFQIDAKMDPDTAGALNKLAPSEQKFARQHMLQALLAEYFKLKTHRESEEIPVYELVVAKGGPKLKEITDPNVPEGGIFNGRSGGTVEFQSSRGAVALENLAGLLGIYSGRPVVDKTGLTGKYEFKLRFTPMNPSATAPGADTDGSAVEPSDSPFLMKAIEEQLGLKLVPAKGARAVIVVDHVELPAKN